MSTTKPRLEQLRQSSGLAALPDSITTGKPGEFGHTITKPIGQATVDDIAFAIQALNSESSEVFRRLDARPPRLLTYGVAGVGKTLFATSAPRPVVVQTEDGLGTISASTFGVLRSFDAVMEALGSLYTEAHDFETLVVDSLDWLEPLVWQHTAQTHNQPDIESFGYGKGYLAALDTWRSFLDGVNALRDERGMGVILIAHAEIKRFDSPETEPYDRYQPKLHRSASALVRPAGQYTEIAAARFV
ncbi:AAA domain-containing protein [Humitalea rosea]|uniref:AAA domain-containing protein n=1 Tax=Humitalea rosea TaxID=990373 RepID=A0A2W7HVP0_9PROT|nr:ATP-binding protein [Humitalea rosea]PZW38716.1 AAA domain-containing protein [Humitalea rosea]